MTALLSMLVLLTSSFVVSSSANDIKPSKAPVQLPIELMGAAGTFETVSVDLSAPGSVAGLWMQVHNLSYDAKGSVKINNGSWIDLTNSSVNVAYPESNIGGIGGGYSTIRITLPLNSGDVVSGANTIQFRFNGTDGLSSGWRVLKFNFVNSAGTFLLPDSQFVEDDPAGWTPILVSQDDINKGADLWYNAALLEANQQSIQAKCSDCHANDGRDLKYFNYSDKSIIARSEFHGLSELEGQQIASYIRSLNVPAPGRPWNPPYQPGPGIDDKPIEEWSAGAGLEWVLDDDGETLDYLFPNGITDEVASTKSTLNMRELPLAIQFPDWNRWLPPVHPVDFWGNAFLSSNAWDSYKNGIPDALSGGVENAILKRSIENAIQGLDSDVSDFRENQPLPSGKTVQDQTQGNLGLQLWQLVKVWDVMQTYDLEGRAPDLYPDGESRSWFSIARNVFNVAPHISSAGGSTVHTHGSWMMDKYFSHAWYMYQLVINAGNRNPQGHRPMDWKYQFGHLGDYSKQTGLPSGARLVASYIKMNQMLDNDNGIGTDGWYIRHTHPYWFARSLVTDSGGPAPLMSSIPVADQARIAEVMLKAFMEKTLEFDVDDWPRGEQHEQLEPVSYRPVGYDGKGTVFEDRFNYADNFYRLIPAFAGAGVPGAALKVVADWGAEAWPNGDWANLTDYSDPGSGGGGGDGGDGGGGDGGDGGGGDGGDGGGGDGGDGGGGDGGDGGGGDGGDGGGGDGGDGGGGDGGGGDPSVTYGDTTEDGSVSALDAAIVLGHLSGNITLDAAGIEAGDVNGDGVLTEDDAILILQRVLGQIDCFPVENGCAT